MEAKLLKQFQIINKMDGDTEMGVGEGMEE